MSALYGTARLEELLRRLADDPRELVLSSCMPVLDVGDGVIFLVPKPVVWQAELPGAAGSRRRVDVKRLKRARWASLGAVNAAGSSEASSLCLSAPDLIETPVVLLQGEETGLRLVFSHPKAGPTALWTSTEESHNTLNRLTGSTTAPGRLYFTSGWAFSTWCSLYALVHAEGAWEDVLMPALRWACDSGLGGRRGMGRASYDLVDVQDTDSLGLKPNPGTDGWLSLGRVVVPAECGLDLRHTAYELSLSHSRVDSSASGREAFKQPTVQMEAGAVLRMARADERGAFWGEAGGWQVCGAVLPTGSLGGLDGPEDEKVPVYTYGVAPCLPTASLAQQGART